MSEREAIDRVSEPITVSSLATDFRDIGIDAGDRLLVHSSLSAIGWIAGGAQAVVEALQQVVTPRGTIMMPTHSAQYTDPADWQHPPVPADWPPIIRQSIPAFRPDVTPSRGMGAIPECFRTFPTVHRSGHPIVSFAACGPSSQDIADSHSLDFGLGEESPLAWLYDAAGKVILLGVSHASNTSLHLAEYRTKRQPARVRHQAPVMRNGRHAVVEFEDIDLVSNDFADLGRAYERDVGMTTGSVGVANAKVMDQRQLVDYAVDWIDANR